MNDMLKTIVPKSNQLNADDLIGGKSLTIKVTKVSIAAGEQPVALNYEGDGGKPYMPAKSMRRVLVNIWGSDANKYVGQSMTLYRDDSVKFGGVDVGGIRISHMSGIEAPVTMALTETKARRKPFTVQPLTSTAPAIDPALHKAGKEAASKGVESYKAWIATLHDDQKPSVRPYHAGWQADARSADAAPKVHDFNNGDPEPLTMEG